MRGIKDDIDCVYMALGLNELGWDPNMYIKTYTNVIGQIREIVDVPIYLQLILPMTSAAYEASEFGVTNDDQIIFNQKLTKMAEDLKLFLLDPCSLFELEDGTLRPGGRLGRNTPERRVVSGASELLPDASG